MGKVGSKLTVNRVKESNYRVKYTASIERLKDAIYKDGTYDIEKLSMVNLTSGYLFSFFQKDDNYSDADYNRIIDSIMNQIEDKSVYASKFGGTSEISFHTNSLETAMRIAQQYNQISV